MTAFNLIKETMDAGYTRKSLAKKLDVHEHSLKRLENGQGVHPATAKKVADFFSELLDVEIRVTDLMPLDECEAA